jgi:hypothetical protein
MICGEKAKYRYTWPGRNESFICEEHSHQLKAIAKAMCFPLQLIEIEPGLDNTCQQKIKEKS